MKNKNGDALKTQGHQTRKLPSTTRTGKGLDHTGTRSLIPPITPGHVSTKINTSQTSHLKNNAKILQFDGTKGSTKSSRTSKDAYKAKGYVRYALNDLPIINKDLRGVKRLKQKSYNQIKSKNSIGKLASSPGEGVKQTNEPRNDLRAISDKTSVRNHTGNEHIQTDVLPRSRYVPEASELHSMNKGHDLTSEEEGATVCDQETQAYKDRLNVEENWAEALKSCRYLRKPRGYETPEVSIESIFKHD